MAAILPHGVDRDSSSHWVLSMRKSRHLSKLASVLAVTGPLVVAACGGDNADNPNASGNTPEQELTLPDAYVGRAALGALSRADVSVFSLSALDGKPIYQTQTSTGSTLDKIGLFQIPAELLSDNELYLVKVSGGEDYDRDDNGQMDNRSSPNTAILHALLTPAEIRRGNYHVSTQTEFMYRVAAYRLAANFPLSDIIDELDYRARDAVGADIDGDGDIDKDDVVAWYPGDPHKIPTSYTLRSDLRGEVTDTASHYVLWEATQDHIQGMDNYFGPSGAGLVSNLTVRDGRAYVAGTTTTNTGAVWTMDVSNAAAGQSKTILGTTPVQADLLATNGHYVYVAEAGVGLHVLDVGTPAAPVEVGTLALTEHPHDMVYANGVVYVAAQASLYAIDVGDPAHPAVTTNLNGLGQNYLSLAQCNEYLVGYEDGSYLNVFDITDPLHPSRILSGWTFGDPPLVMTCVDKHLYSVGQKGLTIVDMSDPASPQPLGSEPLSGSPGGIEVYDGVAYITVRDGNLSYEIRAVDVHDPANPVTIATVPILSEARAVAVDNGRIYLASGAKGILSFSNASLLDNVRRGQRMFSGGMRLDGIATRVASAAGIAYLAGAQSLYALDVKDAQHPLLGGRVDLPTTSLNSSGAPRALLVRGGFAYVGKPYSALWTFDIGDPAAMYLSSQVTDQHAGGIYGLATRGDYLYYVNWWAIQSADITSLSTPQLAGENLFDKDNVTTVAASSLQPMAYVGGMQGRDYLVDLSDPGQPKQLATLNDGTIAISAAVIAGNYLYVVSGYANGGLMRIIDVSVPEHPVVVAKENIFNYPNAIVVQDGYAYIATVQAGVRIIDVHEVTKPYLLGVIDTPGDAFDIAVEGANLYIADGVDGLRISRAATRKLP